MMEATIPPARELLAGQECIIHVAGVDGSVSELWRTSELLLEAPNWTLDGTALTLNGNGLLWRLDVSSLELSQIPLEGVPTLNNDHVLHPDGVHVYVSANDWHIYRAPLSGGAAVRVTGGADDVPGLYHFLHGVAPDGERLAFTGVRPDPDGAWRVTDLWTIGADGTGLRHLPSAGTRVDGPEYSPDGRWLYLNTEAFDGHAQIGRLRPDGSGLEQLTFDARVNWFPHLSPDGRYAAYLAFPSGTAGHPADLTVDLLLVTDDDWAGARSVATVVGGQGTINVNSWSPDSTRFAFVSYPVS